MGWRRSDGDGPGTWGSQNDWLPSLNKTPTHRIASLRLITGTSLRLRMCPALFGAKRIRLCYRAHGCQRRPTAWSSFDMSSTLVMSCTRRNIVGPFRLHRPRRHNTAELSLDGGWTSRTPTRPMLLPVPAPVCRTSIDRDLETLHLASLTTTSDTLAKICVLLGPAACGSSGCGFCSFGARGVSEERRHWLDVRLRSLEMERRICCDSIF